MRNAGDQRSVVVTGALTGIGEVTASILAARGFRVFACVLNASSPSNAVTEANGNLVTLDLDVTDPESISRMTAQVTEMTGKRGLFGLVNNAGVYRQFPLETLPLSEMRRHFEVNVFGTMMVTQALLPALRQARGRIVNMGSISGRLAAPLEGAYAASKFALEALTDVLRLELRPYAISVSIVEPGGVATPMLRNAVADLEKMISQLAPPARDLYLAQIDRLGLMSRESLRKAIPPERVASVITQALCSRRPKARYLVGSDARLLAGLCKVPTPLRDTILAWASGLGRVPN